MGKKRKANRNLTTSQVPENTQYAQEERFDDSEDEFYASRDKILLEDGPATKRRRQLVEQENDLQPSDEEVLQYNETDNDESDEVRSAIDANTEDEDGADGDGVWGLSKADYYNADVIETEADAIEEENEARRLQTKQLKSMTDADYGFDEMQWNRSDQEVMKAGTVVEKLPEVRIPAKAGRQEKVEILENRYPEFVPLAQDLAQLQDTWKTLQTQATEAQTDIIGVTSITKLRALSSYLGAIVMYFAIITSKADPTTDPTRITALSPNELREHTVIKTLMEARKTWDAVKEVKEVIHPHSPLKVAPVEIVHKKVKKEEQSSKNNSKDRVRKGETNFESESEDDFDLDALAPLPAIDTKKRRTKLLDVQSFIAQATAAPDQDKSDFGDEDPLTAEQAVDKAKRKNSLRFYTSQIAQKANKRGAASRQAGGDDDVPRKERLRDKQERLLKDAEKRGQQKPTGDEELGDDDSEGAVNDEDNPYYQSLVAASDRKKAAKQERSAAYAEAAKLGAQVYEAEQIGPDGKRRITYAIEKNKGLTPKRKKDVRNPRVKKRKKYDEKMKKLSSIRQVYKGGEGKGGYGGELTGIKTNVVKSVKL